MGDPNLVAGKFKQYREAIRRIFIVISDEYPPPHGRRCGWISQRRRRGLMW
jgi:hypothetical protein